MAGYNYGYYPQGYVMPQMVQTPVQPVAQTAPQIQNGGLVSVRSELEARNYPIAPGNSITFKDENSPYVYTKTMGFSQLDRPSFEKFRLVREETAPEDNQKSNEIDMSVYALKSDITSLKAEIDSIRKLVEVTDNE